MKKLHFIFSILALTMFVGCQMPTDGTGNTFEAEETEYSITVVATHGTVTLSKTEAKAGEKVFVESISANEGYTAIGMEQKFQSKDGNAITLDFGNENGRRYFVMPECDVVINVTFKATTPTDDTDNNDDTQIETPTEGEDNTGDGEKTEDPIDDTPTVADFVDATDYDVYKDSNFLAKINGKILNTICKNEGFVKDTDYTIEDNKVTVITGSRLYDWLTPQNLDGLVSDDEGGNGNGESGTETSSNTYKVNHGLDNGNYVLDPTNVTDKTYKKGDTVTLPIKTLNYTAPTGRLYLVKTYVTDADNNAVEVTYNKENHTVSFTMPDNDVMVRADFEDVSFKNEYDTNDNGLLAVSMNKSNNSDFYVGIFFTEKVFDNLEYIGGKYVFRVANKNAFNEPKEWSDKNGWHYLCTIETTYTEPKLCAIVGEEVKTPINHKISL